MEGPQLCPVYDQKQLEKECQLSTWRTVETTEGRDFRTFTRDHLDEDTGLSSHHGLPHSWTPNSEYKPLLFAVCWHDAVCFALLLLPGLFLLVVAHGSFAWLCKICFFELCWLAAILLLYWCVLTNYIWDAMIWVGLQYSIKSIFNFLLNSTKANRATCHFIPF